MPPPKTRFPTSRLPALAPLAALVVLSALGFYFVRLPGTEDVSVFWLPWTNLILEQGLVRGYALAQSDYPPGAFLFLRAVAGLALPLGIGTTLALKSALALCAFLNAAILYLWRRQFWPSAAFALALLLSGAALGYLDVVWLPPLLLCLWALSTGRLVAAGACFAVSVFIKWQPIILAPFLALQIGRLHRRSAAGWRDRLRDPGRFALGAALVSAPMLLAFPPAEILRAFTRAGEHPGLSYQALNVNWIIQHIHYHSAGHAGSGLLPFLQGLPMPLIVWPRRVFYLLFAILLGLQAWRGRDFPDFLWFALTGFLTYCTVNNGVHENHLFLVMALAFVIAAGPGSRAWLPAAFAALTANVNLFVFYGLAGDPPFYRPPYNSAPLDAFLLGWSALNFLFFGYCWYRCLRETAPGQPA